MQNKEVLSLGLSQQPLKIDKIHDLKAESLQLDKIGLGGPSQGQVEGEVVPPADFSGLQAGPRERANPTVCFVTLGCKVNQYETEAMRELFLADGYQEVAPEEGADVYVVNTCTVTNVAAKKSRQMLSRGKKKNPASVVIAVGCYVQREHAKLKAINGIDILIGNHRKKEILTILDDFYHSMETLDVVEAGYHKPGYEDLKVSHRHDRTRATIKIQDGCNQFCTYCIIPFARGQVRSRRPGLVVEEITGLVKAGYQEFVITGIHLSSYGLDFLEGPGLIDLLEEVDNIEGVRRLRLGSLEPRLITEEFAQRISRLKALCPHFHLSLQSGCDGVLARMNRRYRRGEFAQGVERLRRVYSNPAITTDIIVGFPQESQAEFEEGLAFVEKIAFADLHVFKYSKREGTKAAQMQGQVAEEIKHERSRQMIALGQKSKQAYLQSFIGQEVEALLEERVEIDGITYMTGHSREYIKLYYQTDQDLSGYQVRLQAKALLQEGMVAD